MRQEYVLAVLEEHVLQYGPATGQICSCGYIAPKDPEQILTQQTKHHRHLAELIVQPATPRDPVSRHHPHTGTAR